jgi:hypothetical protein
MASYLNLEHSESLKAKIDERAPDLFKARKAKPQLQLNKCYKKKTEESKETVCIEKDRDVRSMLELKGLRRVRDLFLIHGTVELVFTIVNRYDSLIFTIVLIPTIVLLQYCSLFYLQCSLLNLRCSSLSSVFLFELRGSDCVVRIALVVMIELYPTYVVSLGLKKRIHLTLSGIRNQRTRRNSSSSAKNAPTQL